MLVLDGVVFHKDETVAIVALGVAEDGTKHMLDFEVGSTENSVVGTALCARLTARGFAPKAGCRLLCLFDGSKALRKSAKTQWSDAAFQRCLVHKERNLRAYLARKDWGELARLMKRLRDVQGEEAGPKALEELRDFVAARNAKALNSLEEAGDDLITVHLLNVPNTLHKSLLSTNIIENSIRNIRRKTGRVMRWRPPDEPSLALACDGTAGSRARVSSHSRLPRSLVSGCSTDQRQGQGASRRQTRGGSAPTPPGFTA